MTGLVSLEGSLHRAVLVWTAVGFAFFAALAAGLDWFGGELLQTIRPINGEIRLAHAEALMEAGYDREALDAYRAALDAEFWGLQNRAFALKQAGTLLVRQRAFEQAIPYFEQSLATGRAPISVHKYYLEALTALGRWDAALDAAGRWLEEATRAKHEVELSRAHGVLGRIALERGDAAEAAKHFEEGNAVHPGGETALALARLAVEQHQAEQAKALLQQVFQSGPEDNVMQEALTLWADAAGTPGGP